MAYAQKQVKIYYDSKWKVCKESKAAYYRIAKMDEKGKAIGLVKDYYITGELQFEGHYSYIDKYDNEKDTKEGLCKWYYKNGRLSQEAYTQDGFFDGLRTHWNDSGEKEYEAHYKKDYLHGNRSTFYANGKLKTSEEFKEGYRVENWTTEWDEGGKCMKTLNEEFVKQEVHSYYEPVDLPHIKSKIIEGKGMLIKCTLDTGFTQWLTFPLDDTSNFTLESTMSYKSGNEKSIYGLLYGYKDMDNNHFFMLNSTGYYFYGSMLDGKISGMEGWMYSEVIHKTSEGNKLKIKKRNNQLQYYINGQLMGSLEYQNLAGNFIGLSIVKGPLEVYFETLKVRQDIGALNRE